jgi:glycosyltransferase involved in cell wall biosynthesis
MQVMKVCQALRQLGHDVTLWVPGDEAHAWAELQNWYGLTTPFEIHWIKGNLRWRRYDLALAAVQQAILAKADVVYTWMFQAAVIGLGRRLPVILEVHDRPRGRTGPLLLQLFLRLPGKKRLLPITHALRRILAQEFNAQLPDDQVVIAPMGVDLERFANLPDPASARRQFRLPERLTAVYAGHFYAGRGLNLLKSLAQAHPEVQFLWVGGRAEAVEEWRQRLQEQGISNVTLTGFIPNQDLPRYLAAGEILLMPYERTIAVSGGGNTADVCSPMKLFEYLAAGRCILSSDLPVFHEVLNEKNAVFCPPDDARAWRLAFGALAEDPARRDQLAAQARRDAAQYAWKTRAERTLADFFQG